VKGGGRRPCGSRFLFAGLGFLACMAGTPQAMAQVSAAPVVAPVPASTGSASTGSDDPTVYQPVDKDERGLWLMMDEDERKFRTDPAVIRDPALNAYVREVLCKLASPGRCAHIRIYITRTPHFNASMAPNGVMQVWSGLLLRTRNEAQLAAVLGHEYSHFENKHTLQLWREVRRKTNAASWINLIPYAGLVSLGLLTSIFDFSREQEREADEGGLTHMAAAGYDTHEAAVVWENLRAEMDATAVVRRTKSRKDRDRGLFETHPPSAERVATLTELARKTPGVPGATGADRYRAALAPMWASFVDDQLKLNDFGGSEFLLKALAGANWTPQLLYARAELYRRRAQAGDLPQARDFYTAAISGGGDLPELWRGRGLTLQKLGAAEQARADFTEYLRRAPNAPDKAMITILTGGS
jgi:hypothetical protein